MLFMPKEYCHARFVISFQNIVTTIFNFLIYLLIKASKVDRQSGTAKQFVVLGCVHRSLEHSLIFPFIIGHILFVSRVA